MNWFYQQTKFLNDFYLKSMQHYHLHLIGKKEWITPTSYFLKKEGYTRFKMDKEL